MKHKKIFVGLLAFVILIGGIVAIRNLDKLISVNKGKSYSTTEEV